MQKSLQDVRFQIVIRIANLIEYNLNCDLLSIVKITVGHNIFWIDPSSNSYKKKILFTNNR
jgi:hypothetical protein